MDNLGIVIVSVLFGGFLLFIFRKLITGWIVVCKRKHQRRFDRKLVAASDAAAKALGLATNADLFAHALNQSSDDCRDPRSQEQRENLFANDRILPLRSKNSDLVTAVSTKTVGFVPSDEPSSETATLLKRQDSRSAFFLNKKAVADWGSKDVVLALGHRRLTATDIKEVTMTYKDIAMTPPTARWRMILVSNSTPDDIWQIESVAFPGFGLSCTGGFKEHAALGLRPLKQEDETQQFRYTQDSCLLPGSGKEKEHENLAVWIRMDKGKVKELALVSTKTKGTKAVNYKNKKGNASTKNKEVDVDIAKRLQWSLLPEEEHLVLLPRVLRTTHTHSSFFRVLGEEVRRDELEAGTETRAQIEGTHLIAYSPLLPFILGASQGDWKKDKFWSLCQLLGCPLVDRTGMLSCPMRFKTLQPIPKMQLQKPPPLSELMLTRAQQLLDDHKSNEPLQVLWSGGIDTTAMLCAFIQVIRSKGAELASKLLVRYCSRSVSEYPKFFEEHVVRLPHKEINGHVRDVFTDGPAVTGDPCDMLMGTFVMATAFRGRHLHSVPNPLHFALEKPWQQIIPKMLRVRGLLTGKVDRAIDESIPEEEEWLQWMRPFVAAAPIPVITTFDWLWWVTYATKYQHDLLRVFYNRAEIPEELRESVINFFAPEDFHQWSFHYHSEKMPDKRVWASYKMPLKIFIRDFTQDDEYFKYKTKVQSVRNSWGHELGITDRWEVIKFGKFSVSMRRLREKYDCDLDRFLVPTALKIREESRGPDGEEDYLPVAAAAVAASAGFLTLAAFQGAEVFDPRQHLKQVDGGWGMTCGE